MKPWLALDADLRLALAAIGGVVLGALVNWAVSSLAYEPRYFSPWSRKHLRDGRSIWLDRLPIFGWLLLARKRAELGGGFWIRPFLVELTTGFGCAALYSWEVLQGGLLPIVVPPRFLAEPNFAEPLHFQFVAHVLLGVSMLAAALIDADEMNIPDSITVPGTLVGLTFITLFPSALLPIDIDASLNVHVLRATFGHAPDALERNFPNVTSLVVGVGCFVLWCGGLLYRPWRTRRGYGVAVRLLLRRVRQDRWTPWIGLLAVVGSAVVGVVWYFDRAAWAGLITALVGLAAGGAVVWITRIIGSWALGREAMGFGDVTLLAMIGAVVGWQAAVLIFFTAPLAALVIGGLQWLATRRNVLPFGPFLCMATAAIVVAWRPVWSVAGPRFYVPWLVPGTLVVGFVLLAIILGLLRVLRRPE